MFLDTNPYLLYITGVVAILHLIFDFLTFKNGMTLRYAVITVVDISFWRNTKSFEGLSLRSIRLNVISYFIIFLYLVHLYI
jgi:hypothetical protein